MYATQITMSVEPTNADHPVGLEVWVDDHMIFDSPGLCKTTDIAYTLDSGDAAHAMRFVLKHKQANHTRIDDGGNIIEDSCINIRKVCMDGINVDVLMDEKALYRHDFNGTAAETAQRFYGQMGCNGVVTLDFTTPIHVWLLENM